MLYKNDVRYDLTKEDLKFVYDFMSWTEGGKKNRPAVIKIPESMYVWDKANNRKVKPNRFNIPLTETEFVDNVGTVTWTYSAAPAIQKDGRNQYSRSHHGMTGTFSVGPEKIDFLFFLIKSRYREKASDESSKLITAAKPLFRIEMKEKESELKLLAHKMKTTVEGYLNGPDGIAWSDDKIRKYAYAFGIEEADDMGPKEVRNTLLGRVSGEPGGYKRFYELVENSDKAEDTFTIKTLLSKELIGKDTKKWFWISDGKKGEQICIIKPKKEPEECLVEELQSNSQLREIFKEILETLEK